MAKQLRGKLKASIIKRIKLGESITDISRENGISRTSIYNWLRQTEGLSSKKALDRLAKRRKVKPHHRKLPGNIENRVIKIVLKNPQVTYRKIQKEVGVSKDYAWQVLKRHNLATPQMRSIRKEISGDSLVIPLAVVRRRLMLERYAAGESVTKLSREFRISRTLFYRIYARYKTLESIDLLRPKGETHYRYRAGARKTVLRVVIEHPTLSIRQLTSMLDQDKGKSSFSRQGLYQVLKELDLLSIEKRVNYASKKPENSTENRLVIDIELPDNIVKSTIHSLSPPYRQAISPLFAYFAVLFLVFYPLLWSIINKTSVNLVFMDIVFDNQISNETISKQDNRNIGMAQNFYWGVLAINTDKASYEPFENSNFSLGVLDHKGEMVCDAEMQITIRDPQGQETVLSTQDKSIIISDTCSSKEYNLQPDYFANFQNRGLPGDYIVTVKAKTSNGDREVQKSFTVGQPASLSIARKGTTRIFPVHNYPMSIHIKANERFRGKIYERVPLSFKIAPAEDYTVKEYPGYKELVWHLDIKKGEVETLNYFYQSNYHSPEFYSLGEIRAQDYSNHTPVVSDSKWGIAVDSVN